MKLYSLNEPKIRSAVESVDLQTDMDQNPQSAVRSGRQLHAATDVEKLLTDRRCVACGAPVNVYKHANLCLRLVQILAFVWQI